MTLTIRTGKTGNPTATITRPGYYPTIFVSYGPLPFGKRELDVRLIQGVPLNGDWEAARAALEEKRQNDADYNAPVRPDMHPFTR